jgi:hypothetical protein
LDDVTHTSLDYDPAFVIEPKNVVRAVFWGLGSDGTVGANKNSIKIIGEETDNYAQGYFVYDSKKSGARTVSHLRFGPQPIHSTYLIQRATFVAVHQFGFFQRYDMLGLAEEGAVLLLNAPFPTDQVWDNCRAWCRSRSSPSASSSTPSTPTKWPTRSAWAGASTRSCRPASSPSAACCRATRPSPASRSRSRRPTASAARPW